VFFYYYLNDGDDYNDDYHHHDNVTTGYITVSGTHKNGIYTFTHFVKALYRKMIV